ncbi:unannotated protein [freshwater metagenome]|uniref:Unannotated protein n=1 Tax=freshwater metagenome TaxID=449393 RepID=A0A6J7HPP8_9ZZZZ|nr:hypothetical protein [Actinomycetota bacterium]
MAGHAEPGVVIDHPNRETDASRLTRAAVVALLLISAALICAVLVGGWSALQGMRAVCVLWVIGSLGFAFYVWRWNRGVLPVIAALAVIMMIFALLAVPSWFDRDAPGYSQPALSAGVLGALTAIIVAVQVLLAAVALQGFTQAWNVEVERPAGEDPGYEPDLAEVA